MHSILFDIVLVSVGVGLGAGMLGPLLVWNRLAYFADSVAHSSVLAVILARYFRIDPVLAIVLMSASFCALAVRARSLFDSSTVFVIFNSSALAVAVLVLHAAPQMHLQPLNILAGDILSAGLEIATVYAIAAVCGLFLLVAWKELLVIAVSKDIARAENIRVTLIEGIFLILLTVFIASAMQIVGALLVNAVLVIPAATARLIARTPLQMAVLSCLYPLSCLCWAAICL